MCEIRNLNISNIIEIFEYIAHNSYYLAELLAFLNHIFRSIYFGSKFVHVLVYVVLRYLLRYVINGSISLILSGF